MNMTVWPPTVATAGDESQAVAPPGLKDQMMFPVAASKATAGPNRSAAYTREPRTAGEPTTGLVNVCFHFNFKGEGTLSVATPVWSGLLRYIDQSAGEATPELSPIPTRIIATRMEAETGIACCLFKAGASVL